MHDGGVATPRFRRKLAAVPSGLAITARDEDIMLIVARYRIARSYDRDQRCLTAGWPF